MLAGASSHPFCCLVTQQISQSPKLAVSSLLRSWPPGPRPWLERSLSHPGHPRGMLSLYFCLSVSPSLSLSVCLSLYFSVYVSLSISPPLSVSLCLSNSVWFFSVWLGTLKTQTSDMAAPRTRGLKEASTAAWPLSSEPQKSHEATETPHRFTGREHGPHFLSGGLSKNLRACFKTTRLGTGKSGG